MGTKGEGIQDSLSSLGKNDRKEGEERFRVDLLAFNDALLIKQL